VLAADAPSRIPTLLCSRATWLSYADGTAQALANGVFQVTNGAESFFTLALSDTGVRYDPGCMTPCDARAHDVAELFQGASASSFRYTWQDAQSLLAIDNTATLHARDALVSGDKGRMLLRLAFRTGVRTSDHSPL
jgi:hypothetical protein